MAVTTFGPDLDLLEETIGASSWSVSPVAVIEDEENDFDDLDDEEGDEDDDFDDEDEFDDDEEFDDDDFEDEDFEDEDFEDEDDFDDDEDDGRIGPHDGLRGAAALADHAT